MANEKCNGCELYKNGYCTKWRKNGECNISTKAWFNSDSWQEPMEFIPIDRMCRYGSIFGNAYIGITQSDIDRLKNGEVIHIAGEYGTFIGFIDEEAKK